jgi:nitroreductase
MTLSVHSDPAHSDSMSAPLSTDLADVLFDAICNRRSMGLSRLSPDPVDRRLIERMLEAANWAPSHGDTEPWRFTVFAGEGRATLAALFAAAHREETGGNTPEKASEGALKRAYAAPVWISIGMSPARREDGSLLMSENEELMAVACAVQNLHLMASALGLAGMWHSKGLSVSPVVARGLGLEPPARLLGFFMCGWPATDWLTSSRRPLTEKVHWVE